MAPPPVVTGLSPKEGPPGTRVTIRGEFLGNRPTDLIGLTICGCDCLLSADWKSKNKIIARSGPGKGQGDIIVTTKAGGQGSSTVQFRGYHESIGPMKESAVWVEESGVTTLSWGRRPLSPTSYAPPDPLGLSTEADDNKFPDDDLLDMFPDLSGDLSAENFHPGWFLLEHHHATSFDDLKAGTLFLRRKVEGQKEGQLSFLKANTGAVMDQLDRLILLKNRFETDVREGGKEPIQKLQVSIQDAISEANKVFESVLTRKERADATRAALAVLTRHKFLFQLPANIDRSIAREDYHLVVNDYARAMNLFGKSDVGLFKKVLAEVEKRIENLRHVLHSKLQKMPSSIGDQKKIIRSLVSLYWPGDAAWDALNSRKAYIARHFEKIKQYYVQLELSEEDHGRSGNVSMSECPARVSLVGALRVAVGAQLPPLWRLARSYFAGELGGTPTLQERHTQFKEMILSAIEQFSSIVRGAILPASTLAIARSNSTWSAGPPRGAALAAWLPHCLSDLRAAHADLIRLDLPTEALAIVGSLIQDMRHHCMVVLMKKAVDGVKEVQESETWKTAFDPEHGGITKLPSQFEKLVCENMTVVKESVLTEGPREKPLLELGSLSLRQLNAYTQEMMIAFVRCMENLAFNHDEQDTGQSPMSVVLGSPETGLSGHPNGHAANTGVPWQRRLLIMLSNCRYTQAVIITNISTFYEKNSFPNPIIPVETARSALHTLEKSITEAYLEQKSDPLVGTIEPSMYLGHFDWNTKCMPTDVRQYVYECVNNLIAVHAEINSVCSVLCDVLVSPVVDTVCEELARLMSCAGSGAGWSRPGALQARVDITALGYALRPLMTDRANTRRLSDVAAAVVKGRPVYPVQSTLDNSGCNVTETSGATNFTRSFYNEALECIPAAESKEDHKLIDKIQDQFQSRLRLQLLCFKKH